MKGDWAEAVTHGEQALALFRQTGDQAGQGWALAGLGECHAHLGNYDLARGYARQALEVAPRPATPHVWPLRGTRWAWCTPGSASTARRSAVTGRPWPCARERKHPLARGMLAGLLAAFGDACRAAGDLPAAVEAWQQALQILRRPGIAGEPRDPRQARAGRPAQPAGLIVRLPRPPLSGALRRPPPAVSRSPCPACLGTASS